MKASRIACIAISLLIFLPAQLVSQEASTSQARPQKSAKTAQKQAVKQQQEQGIALIEQAVSEAGRYDAGGRAAIYFLAGHALVNRRTELANEMFQTAYRTLDELQHDETPGLPMLKANIIRETTMALPEEVEHALPEQKELRDTALATLVDVYVKKRDADHAIYLLSMLDDPVIYVAAHHVLDALPKNDSERRERAFGLAVDQYRQTQHTANIIGFPDDLGTLTTRFWSTLPRPAVMDAIEVLLREAESNKTDSLDSKRSTEFLAMRGSDGAKMVDFYGYRLNQLLPVLRQLDPTKAEKLVENGRAAPASSSAKGDPDAPTGTSTVAIARNSGEAIKSSQLLQRQQFVDDLVSRSEKDPKAAMDTSANVPDPGLRAAALVGIAKGYASKDSKLATQALHRIQFDEHHRAIPLRILKEAAQLADQIGDRDLERTFAEECFALARALYDQDNDKDHPNRALKLYWPSTHAWRDAFQLAFSLDPEYAVSKLKELPDPEVGSLQRVFLASAFLKVPVWNADSPIR